MATAEGGGLSSWYANASFSNSSRSTRSRFNRASINLHHVSAATEWDGSDPGLVLVNKEMKAGRKQSGQQRTKDQSKNNKQQTANNKQQQQTTNSNTTEHYQNLDSSIHYSLIAVTVADIPSITLMISCVGSNHQ